MLFGAALVVVGASVLYYVVTGEDPRSLLAPGRYPKAPWAGGGVPTGAAAGRYGIGPQGSGSGKQTGAIRVILAAARAVPGWRLGRVCGSDTLAGEATSEHVHCNAADLFVPSAFVGNALAAFLVAGARAGILPVHCVIWARTIWSRETGWQARPYSGASPHTDHVHVSGWPSIGGAC